MAYKIGLFGFGCVAQGFYAGLKQNPQLNAEIKKICVKNGEKQRPAPVTLFTTNPDEILFDPDIDVIIELIDDADAACKIIQQSMLRGTPIISANKKALASHLAEIIHWEKQYGGNLLYEGAVAGSIPILRNIDQFYANQEIKSIRGILNGTTNYILTLMQDEKLTYIDALQLAIDKGFAESNPYLDVSGLDAVYKTILLAYRAFGSILTVADVIYEGIEDITIDEIKKAEQKGKKIKLVASLQQTKQGINAVLSREVLDAKDPLFNVDHELNAVSVEGNLSGVQTFIGRGAGSLPTGSAVLYDLKQVLDEMDRKSRGPIFKKTA